MSTTSEDLITRLQQALGPRVRIERELSGGGMSRVFLASDLGVSRPIVVKVIPPDSAQVLQVELFHREIQIAASLQHPNIVPVLAAGEVEGLPWYTMQFVDGKSLRDRLDAGRVEVADAIKLLRDLTRAVAYAHRRDIVHRDLKPENVLISDGVPMVTDFGIAKALSHTRKPEDGPSPTTGFAFGTPAYMAPEQMTADPAMDHRADLYALGVIAFEVFSGVRPFTGSSRELFVSKMTERAPDLSTRCPDVPPPLAALVMRCLEPNPEHRPQSAGEILSALEDAASNSYAGLLPLLQEPRRMRRAVAAYLGGVVAVGAVAWGSLRLADVPDWVLPGALGSIALVFPLVLTTALTRYTAHQTMSRHAWHPSALTAEAQGGVRALALRMSRALSWRRVLRGTVTVMVAFVLFVVGHSALRAAGIGSPGTLVAAGIIAPHQVVLVTDFGSAPADSARARLVAEAIRIGLQESRSVNVMSPEDLADALRRMQRPADERVTLELARQVSRREGIPVIIDGDLTRGARGALITVRIVDAASGTPRAVTTHRARDDDRLLDAAGQALSAIRTKLGDSFRDVRAAARLPLVTTASLEALEMYARATKAWHREGDRALALELFQRAVAIDSGFASAWRSISFIAGGLGQPDVARAAAAAAFRHRHRAPLPERLLIEGSFYSGGAPEADIAKAIAAYEHMLEMTGRPHNNLAWLQLNRKEYALAEQTYRRVIENEPDGPSAYNGMFWTLLNLGKYDAADSLAAEARARFPDVQMVRRFSAELPCALGDERGCVARLDSAVLSHPALRQAAWRAKAQMAIRHGRLAEARRLLDEMALPWLGRRYIDSAIDLWVVGRPERSASEWAPVFADRSPAIPNLWMGVASHLASAGHPELAREALRRMDEELPDSLRPLMLRMILSVALGDIAAAEGRWREAVVLYRAANTHPTDGRPVNLCPGCVELAIGQTFARVQQSDSAIFWLEKFLSTPHFWIGNEIDNFNLATVYEQLGGLYDARGDSANAVRHYHSFVNLWENADPELQPRVRAARERIDKLGAPR